VSVASQRQALPSVIWASARPIGSALDSATWLETTSELLKLGWPVTLVAEGPTGQQRIEGVDVSCLSRPRFYILGYCLFHLRLLFFLARVWAKTDAVLFHQKSAPWVLPLRVIRNLLGQQGPQLIMDTRDVVALGAGLRNRLRRLFFRFAHYLANHWADGQTAITPRMAQLVGIPSGHLWGTWPSGVDLERFRPAQEDRRWPEQGDPIHLMYIGSFVGDRNLALLCRAVEDANAQGMAFILSLVGDGLDRQALERIALQSEGGIRVLPPVPHDRVPGLLRQAHVGVTSLPSSVDRKFEASSPIKLFEYMAAGLPVMATDNACHTDVVGEGTYAFWVREPTLQGVLVALRLVAQSRDGLRDRGARAAAAARSWTWQEAGRKLGVALEHGLVLSKEQSFRGRL
jgi:glycosyltransferase involved in cell wall biosynthesis